MELQIWEHKFEAALGNGGANSPSHDLSHVKRVVGNAKRIATREKANIAVVVPSAWLHDFVVIAKNEPARAMASSLAAEKAISFLRSEGYPEPLLPAIHHCIQAHSFSAGIEPQTIEAKVVQDADRLDAIGAIGIARCFSTAGENRQSFYCWGDPFGHTHEVDDRQFALDHFYKKLLPVARNMKTKTAQIEARRRESFLMQFIAQLESELDFIKGEER
jgi:uncharacterized protein